MIEQYIGSIVDSTGQRICDTSSSILKMDPMLVLFLPVWNMVVLRIHPSDGTLRSAVVELDQFLLGCGGWFVEERVLSRDESQVCGFVLDLDHFSLLLRGYSLLGNFDNFASILLMRARMRRRLMIPKFHLTTLVHLQYQSLLAIHPQLLHFSLHLLLLPLTGLVSTQTFLVLRFVHSQSFPSVEVDDISLEFV